MKLSIFLTATFFLLSSITFSKIWILDTNPGNLAKDFTSLQAAHNSPSVLNGDTLYLSGFNISYGNLTLTKQLHIFGPGYFLTQNDSTQANPSHAEIKSIVFNSGSEGSTIAGCYIPGNGGAGIIVNVNNISIIRNRIEPTTNGISANGISNLNILQNYIGGYNSYAIYLNGVSTSIIRNNYLVKYFNHYPYISLAIETNCANIIVENNVLRTGIIVNNTSFYNNILYDGSFTGSNNSIYYNICNSTQFPANGTNQRNVNMTTVFLLTGSPDGYWQLAPGSPAKGTGYNGTDIGMFGGNDPYYLSGIPPIPTIYEFLGSNTGSQSLPVQAKIKSRK